MVGSTFEPVRSPNEQIPNPISELKQAIIWASITPSGILVPVHLNKAQVNSFIDRRFFESHAADPKTKLASQTFFSTAEKWTTEYATIDVYVPGFLLDQKGLAHFVKDMWVIDNLGHALVFGTVNLLQWVRQDLAL